MALLFAVGVMNLIWVAALTVFILASESGRAARSWRVSAGWR
jgi:predicted metal-binding membrane protein